MRNARRTKKRHANPEADRSRWRSSDSSSTRQVCTKKIRTPMRPSGAHHQFGTPKKMALWSTSTIRTAPLRRTSRLAASAPWGRRFGRPPLLPRCRPLSQVDATLGSGSFKGAHSGYCHSLPFTVMADGEDSECRDGTSERSCSAAAILLHPLLRRSRPSSAGIDAQSTDQ